VAGILGLVLAVFWALATDWLRNNMDNEQENKQDQGNRI